MARLGRHGGRLGHFLWPSKDETRTVGCFVGRRSLAVGLVSSFVGCQQCSKHNPVLRSTFPNWPESPTLSNSNLFRSSLRGCCNTTTALAGSTVPFETLQAHGDVRRLHRHTQVLPRGSVIFPILVVPAAAAAVCSCCLDSITAKRWYLQAGLLSLEEISRLLRGEDDHFPNAWNRQVDYSFQNGRNLHSQSDTIKTRHLWLCGSKTLCCTNTLMHTRRNEYTTYFYTLFLAKNNNGFTCEKESTSFLCLIVYR